MDRFRYWFTGSLEDVFADTMPFHFSPTTGYIDMARNEGESIQLAVHSECPVTVSVEVLPFAEEKAPRIECGLIHFAYASEQSYDIGRKVIRGVTPCEFPEYIRPLHTVELGAGESRGFFLTAWTDADTEPGEYATTIRLTAGEILCEIPLAVRVRNVLIPPATESDYSYTCWIHTVDTTPTKEASSLQSERMHEFVYGIQNYSEEFWTLLANYAKAMKRQRQDVVSVPIRGLLIENLQINEDGTYVFDFSKLDRYIETFLTNGAFRRLEGNHLFWRDFWFNPPAEDYWNQCDVIGWVYEKDENGAPRIGFRLVGDPELETHLKAFLTPLYEHLKEKGWDKMWMQHVADEMASDKQLRATCWGYEMVHQCMPGVRTIDAVNSRTIQYYGDKLNVHVPILYEFEEAHRDLVAFAAANDNVEVWDYTCMLPHQDYLSRLGDYKLICTRLLHWYNYKRGASGYLHWGWNFWYTGKVSNKPFEDTCTFDGGYATDAWLVFPDVENLNVWETVRTHANRDGLEDRELLRLAAQKNPEAVKMLLNVMLADPRDFDTDPNTFMRIREQLLDIAEGK